MEEDAASMLCHIYGGNNNINFTTTTTTTTATAMNVSQKISEGYGSQSSSELSTKSGGENGEQKSLDKTKFLLDYVTTSGDKQEPLNTSNINLSESHEEEDCYVDHEDSVTYISTTNTQIITNNKNHEGLVLPEEDYDLNFDGASADTVFGNDEGFPEVAYKLELSLSSEDIFKLNLDDVDNHHHLNSTSGYFQI